MSDLGEFDDIPAEPEDDLEHPDDALSPEPMGPREIYANLLKQIDEINIADRVDTQTLETLGQLVVTEFGIDETSRAEWKDQIDKAMDFATQNAQEKQFPWPKACFSLDTDLLTSRGWKPVAEIGLGELVYSRAPGSGAAGYFPVTQTFRHRAEEVVHFDGKSIDLLVTPNHRMLVQDRETGVETFIEAGDFITSSKKKPAKIRLAGQCIPLTSDWFGACPATVYGIPAKAYMRLLGWYVSEGSRFSTRRGDNVSYGSFAIAQSKKANPRKFEILRRDIEACGFGYSENESGFIVHASTMPDLLKQEWRSLGTAYEKHLPRFALGFNAELLRELLDTMVAGDGCTRRRAHYTAPTRSYFTTSRLLADQVQEICQKIGLRGTISTIAARAGGVINGRTITGAATGYSISIAAKKSVQVLKLRRTLKPYHEDVACVEVQPHHTLLARRNGKAVWVGNSNTIYPIITSAALQFQARTYPAIIQNRNVAKGVVWGSDKGTPAMDPETKQPIMGPDNQPVWLSAPGEKRQRADRIGQHLSYQLLEEIPEWEPQTDAMLGVLPVQGGFVRKTFYDPVTQVNCSVALRITDLVWNFYAPTFETAQRHTELVRLYPTEIETLERAGVFLPHEYGHGSEITDNTGSGTPTPSPSPDPDAPVEFLEQHRRYDLDGDGYAEPYVVTVVKRDAKVVRITARYDEDGIQMGDEGVIKITPWDHYTLYPFLPNPKSGSHPLGWGHVLKPLNEAVNTCFNQMFDAGTLQNAGGGFIGTGLSLHSGPVNFQVGRYVPVNNKGQDIRNSVYPIPWPGPSAVLFQLLELLIGAAKELSATQDILSGDALQANMQPTTLLALIEQGSKYYTSIQKRIYRAMKSELQKLYSLNRKYMKEKARYRVGDEWLEVTPDDYRLGGGVEPIADPTMVTDMQRMGRAQVLMSMSSDPMINGLEVRRRFFEMIGIDRIDEILVPPNPLPAQMALAKAQAELADLRSVVQKNTAQALLFMSQAQSEAGSPVAKMAENLLEMIRLHLEALNTANKASEIQSKHHVAMEGIKQDARNTAAKLGAAATGGTKAGGVQPVETAPSVAPVQGIPSGSGQGLSGPGDLAAAE